ncbi:hypothetical protein ACFV2Z_12980 [Streptomyces sp. NPDC059688]|uniref:Carboxypeptidase regulatory-like domain-containing protein n=1 Tax=Streptomyces albidocamelliae TaxID=2981135 RepID=A0ABY6EWY0_9ACTN|nr:MULTISPECIES: hypothetical protein [unclassified Streptomyces]ROP46864.1 hypothetical protein EDD94_6533 [Streptomyces sp. PanSC9]UXY38924.1 hypothetical protein N8I86_31905 [Streptomyces sp. HUAS 14-6]
MTGHDGHDTPHEGSGGSEFEDALLEEELRQAAVVLDPVPDALRRLAVDAYALHDLDARIAELTFDSLMDALPVRGVTDVPRMLTFRAGEVTVDVEVTDDGLIGQVLPPRSASIEVLGGPQTATRVTVDTLGRFTSDTPPSGPFALRLRTGAEVIVTEWLRA